MSLTGCRPDHPRSAGYRVPPAEPEVKPHRVLTLTHEDLRSVLTDHNVEELARAGVRAPVKVSTNPDDNLKLAVKLRAYGVGHDWPVHAAWWLAERAGVGVRIDPYSSTTKPGPWADEMVLQQLLAAYADKLLTERGL